MASLILKSITVLGALAGGLIALLSVVLATQGVFSSLGGGTLSLKIGFTVARVTCLLLCTWAAWRAPEFAAPFAWGACAAFAIGAAADQIYERGLIGGFGNLIPAYYWTVLIHAFFAVAVWFLASKARGAGVGA